MGKQARLKAERRAAGPDPHLPDPAAPIPGGRYDPRTRQATIPRPANFWRELPGRRVACDLCYRACALRPGEAGWCGFRENAGGAMRLREHGVLASCVRQMRGYQVDPFLTYKPGALSLFLGGVHCTAGCSFCMSKEITWAPRRVPWAYGGERRPGQDGGWYNHRAMLHPAGAVGLARDWGCSQVEFGINEPLLSWEFTRDVARLAREAGLEVVVETNGFSTPVAVRHLGPLVAAVDVGIKGSADPAFYDRWMRSPGAVPHVLASIGAWRAAGVHLIVGDVIAPGHMQSDAAFEEAARRLYTFLAEEAGEHTVVILTQMMTPGPAPDTIRFERFDGALLPKSATADDHARYVARIARAAEIAHACGLPYAHQKTNEEAIYCHACGGLLLRLASPQICCGPCTMATHYCQFWTHEQHATGGRCDHCGAPVPIATLTPAELAAARAIVAARAGEAAAERLPIGPVGRRSLARGAALVAGSMAGAAD
jgi:pyruvate formate lyase activating enzyme